MEAYELALRKAIRQHEAELENMRRALVIHEAVLADLEIMRQASQPAKTPRAKRSGPSREA